MKKKSGTPEEENEEVLHADSEYYFFTFDLGLATALISVGFSLISLDRENLRKVQFVFRRSEGMDDTVDAYWENKLEVKARTYFDTSKMLKNRLYSE